MTELRIQITTLSGALFKKKKNKNLLFYENQRF